MLGILAAWRGAAERIGLVRSSHAARKGCNMRAKRIGVVLAGCGVQDGAEIHESVLTLLALDRAGAEIVCMAPDRDQADVINHVTGQPTGERRNVLVEAARIARGKIRAVTAVQATELDGIVLPGGFGAAKNICTFAADGAACSVDPGVAALLRDMHATGKPIAALCIAPAVLAALFGKNLQPELTIGNDPDTAAALERMGARHRTATVTEVVVDRRNRFVTTPCYMYDARLRDVAAGAEKAIQELLALTPA
jgi:enhancing lycopene biosynthesis protein 2